MALCVLAVGLALFEPWRLFTRTTVNEDPPVASSRSAEPSTGQPTTTTPSPTRTASPTPTNSPSPPLGRAVVLSSGRFITQEHQTTGTARILKLGDGSRYVRLEGFSTSDGPDLHVWITDQTAGGSWGKYEDGRALRLGELKATDGNQNYLIPEGAALSGMRSIVIWCDRFNVAFGSAPVRA